VSVLFAMMGFKICFYRALYNGSSLFAYTSIVSQYIEIKQTWNCASNDMTVVVPVYS